MDSGRLVHPSFAIRIHQRALPIAFFNCFSELDPSARNPKPRFLIKHAYCPFGVLPGFLGLLADPGCFLFGHKANLERYVGARNSP
jgi:hypothetical protein